MQKDSKKFVKVLNVRQGYRIENSSYEARVVPDVFIIKIVDTTGAVRSVRVWDPVNVGDEIDIVSTKTPEYGTMTEVVHNYTQQEIINDFVAKNKTKKR